MAQHVRAFIVLGMLLRVLWAILIPVEPVSDSVAYDVMARTILHHGVYGFEPDNPSAYWAVGTSAVTAATYFVMGESYFGVVTLNLIMSFLLMYLVWQVGQQYFSHDAAACAVLIVALWPNLIFFTTIISSELHFMTLTLAGLYFWSRETGNRWLNLALCGVIWGFACYMRPVILLFPAAMCIAAFSQGVKATMIAAMKAGIAIALILLMVSPWTARNAEVIGKAYTVSSNFGVNLWMGNNPNTTGGFMPFPPEVDGMSEVEREEYLKAIATAYISEEPGAFAARVGKRLIDLHSRETIGVVWNGPSIERLVSDFWVLALKLLATLYWIALVIGALVGLGLQFREVGWGALFQPVFGGWAYFTAVHAIIVSGDRYHMPSAPFVALLAGVALWWVIQRVTQKQEAAA